MRRSSASSSAKAVDPNGAELGERVASVVRANVEAMAPPKFTTLTVSIGAETHSPKAYSSFTVGPFSATVAIEPGEDIEHAYLRARARLTALVETEFLLRTKEFEDHRKRARGHGEEA